MRTTYTRGERIDALLEMWESDGSTPAGDPPDLDHIRSLREARDKSEIDAVTDAHKRGEAPPDVGGGG